MSVFSVDRTILRLSRSIRAYRHGWRWEKCDVDSFVPLADRTWSTLEGGQIWRRWIGDEYEYRQMPERPAIRSRLLRMPERNGDGRNTPSVA